MRNLIFLVVLALLSGCKSNKNIVSDKSIQIDSLTHSENHRTVAVIESISRSTSFDFDTLEVTVERPSATVDAPEIFRLKAVKGRVIDRRKQLRDSAEAYNSLDTVAYKKSAIEASTEHSATTRLYNPPNGTTAVIITILVIGGLICIIYRKR